MALEWITPKTDWTLNTPFTYVDYNRIRNNLLYLNDKFNEMYPDTAQTLDLGEAKTGYTNEYYPSEFNAFEEALISFKRIGQNLNIGSRNYYKSNCEFISFNDLNRIESCCLRWNNSAFVEITEFYITPTESSPFNVGDIQTFDVHIEPTKATRKNDWTCENTNSGFEMQKISNTQFTAKNIKSVGEFDGNNTLTESSGFSIGGHIYTTPYYYRSSFVDNEYKAPYSVSNTNRQGTKINSDSTNLVFTNTGSLFSFKANNYPIYSFMLIGNGIDGSNISTLLTMMNKHLGYTWGDDYSVETYHDDRVAPWRTVFQNVIDTEFSGNLKNALKSVSKIVHYSATSTGSYSSKYHLPSLNELGLIDSHITTLGNKTYPYIIENGFSPIYTDTSYSLSNETDFTTRSLWNDEEHSFFNLPPDNRSGITVEYPMFRGAPLPIFFPDYSHKTLNTWNYNLFYPLIFLKKTLHVKPYLDEDNGFYMIDWTGKSNLTLNDIPLGSYVIDATGERAIQAIKATSIKTYNGGIESTFCGMRVNDTIKLIYAKILPTNCSTLDDITLSYDDSLIEITNPYYQGNDYHFTVHALRIGVAWIEISLDGITARTGIAIQ